MALRCRCLRRTASFRTGDAFPLRRRPQGEGAQVDCAAVRGLAAAFPCGLPLLRVVLLWRRLPARMFVPTCSPPHELGEVRPQRPSVARTWLLLRRLHGPRACESKTVHVMSFCWPWGGIFQSSIRVEFWHGCVLSHSLTPTSASSQSCVISSQPLPTALLRAGPFDHCQPPCCALLPMPVSPLPHVKHPCPLCSLAHAHYVNVRHVILRWRRPPGMSAKRHSIRDRRGAPLLAAVGAVRSQT